MSVTKAKNTIPKPKRLTSSGTRPCWTSIPSSASRGHPDAPPSTMSDGWGGIDDTMIAVYGQVPKYAVRGRPPTRKQPQTGWQYLQIVKHRDAYGHLLNTELRVIFGQPDEVLSLFGKSAAYIERTHLTMRSFNGRLVRHTLGFSRDVDMYRASAACKNARYNLVRLLKTLRLAIQDVPGRRGKPLSPKMAAGLTDHLWTVKELLTTIALPNA
jgi:hypothetical protein